MYINGKFFSTDYCSIFKHKKFFFYSFISISFYSVYSMSIFLPDNFFFFASLCTRNIQYFINVSLSLFSDSECVVGEKKIEKEKIQKENTATKLKIPVLNVTIRGFRKLAYSISSPQQFIRSFKLFRMLKFYNE